MTYLPPIGLSVLLTQGNGDSFRLDPDHPDAEKQPYGLSFQTTNEGFGEASFSLRREAGHASHDLQVLNDVKFLGVAGDIGYHGRLTAAPSAESLDVSADGWKTAMTQREDLRELIVDRDTTNFSQITYDRQALLLDLNATLDKSVTGNSDGGQLVFSSESGQSVPTGSRAELAYVAPLGCLIRNLEYVGSEANTGGVSAATAIFADADEITNQLNVNLTLDNTRRVAAPSSPRRSVILGSTYNATTAVVAGSPHRRLIDTAVWGNHPLTKRTRTDGLPGVFASDAIIWLVERYAPKIDTSRVQQTSYPIPHLVWHDATTLQAMLQQINSFHSWRLAVWENRMLEFGPYDYGEADWKCANGINGVKVELTGDTSEKQFNGCVVSYTDFNGVRQMVGPWTSAELRDESAWIAANQWGDQAYLPIEVEWACSQSDAVLIGAIALADANRAQRPCQITIPYHAQTVNGTWEPCWKVRADQTIAVMNESYPGPRMITETRWQANEVVITTDNAINTLDALQRRISGALAAHGLS